MATEHWVATVGCSSAPLGLGQRRSRPWRPSGLQAGSTAEGLLWLYDIAAGTTLTHPVEGLGRIASVATGGSQNDRSEGSSSLVAVGDSAGQTFVWVPASDSVRMIPTHTKGKISSLAFDPKSRTLAVSVCRQLLAANDSSNCTTSEVQFWNIDTLKQEVEALRGRSGYISALAFSSDGRWLAAGTVDNAILLWEMDGRQLRFVRVVPSEGGVTAMAFSTARNLLAAGFGSSRVYLWQIPSGQPYGDSFPDHDETIVDLAFSSDGLRLFSASTDRTVVMHDLDTKDWVSLACCMAGRTFNAEEIARLFLIA